jgi:hypothetical protein
MHTVPLLQLLPQNEADVNLVLNAHDQVSVTAGDVYRSAGTGAEHRKLCLNGRR